MEILILSLVLLALATLFMTHFIIFTKTSVEEIKKSLIEKKAREPICEKCNKPVPDYEPRFCCNGQECGCMGLPIEPCLCDNCWDEILPIKPKE